MERFGRLTAVLATVMLAWFEPSPCRAQSSAPLPSTSPPVQQTTSTTTSSPARQGPSTGARSTTRVPPPRPWRAATSTAQPDQRPPSSRAAGSPAADPAVRRGAQNMPQPLPPSTEPPVPPPAPRDLMAAELKAAPLEPTDLRLSDQPRHRLAALRRPAADRGRCPGQRLGGRSAAHAGQGPLGSSIEPGRRLYPARRRRPGFQQGHPDRTEREFLLRRWRLVGDRRP